MTRKYIRLEDRKHFVEVSRTQSVIVDYVTVKALNGDERDVICWNGIDRFESVESASSYSWIGKME